MTLPTRAAIMPALPTLTTPRDFAGDAGRLLPRTLDELALLVRRERDLTRYPAKPWVLPRAAPDGSTALDVLVVGGGQAGLAAAFGLMQQQVDNLLVVDALGPGEEGPWNSYARMETLRTQKDVGGIELGIPQLSFRAWYEVQHGPSWETLYKIPTGLWHDYLQWYRAVTGVPVRNHCRLRRLEQAPGGLVAAEVEQGGTRHTLWARTVVLATGIGGNAVCHVPAFVADALPRRCWAHTQDAIDFAALAGKAVAVLGGGASAFDNAIVAAEAGARVDLFQRAETVRPVNATAWGEFTGYLAHYPDLPPLDRWRFSRQVKRFRTGPPLRTIERAARLDNLTIHTGCAWNAVRPDGDGVLIEATDGRYRADFLILGTGYAIDLSAVEELAEHLSSIALWSDRFAPPAGEEDAGLAGSLFLGPNFEILEKQPGAAPWLGALFNFNRGAALSMGVGSIGLSGVKFGVPRLVHGVTRRLFVEDAAAYGAGQAAWQSSEAVYEP